MSAPSVLSFSFLAASASRFVAAMSLSLPPLFFTPAVFVAALVFAIAVIALSLVPLTGIAGQISLAPFAFAGIGAMTMHLVAPGGSPAGLLVVAVVCAVVGALVATPVVAVLARWSARLRRSAGSLRPVAAGR